MHVYVCTYMYTSVCVRVRVRVRVRARVRVCVCVYRCMHSTHSLLLTYFYRFHTKNMQTNE